MHKKTFSHDKHDGPLKLFHDQNREWLNDEKFGIRDCKQKGGQDLRSPPRPGTVVIVVKGQPLSQSKPKHNLSIRAAPVLFRKSILTGSASYRTQTGTSCTAQIATSGLAQSLAHRLDRELSMGSRMRSSGATNGNAAGGTLICGQRRLA